MAGTRKLLRGHYNPTNWSRKQPNLQKTRTPEGKRLTVCTKCIRTMSKATKKPASSAEVADVLPKEIESKETAEAKA